jgi:hypothetical protein
MHSRIVPLALALGISACTTVGHEKVEGWPSLQIVEHYVPHETMVKRCSRYVGFAMVPLACAEFDFAAARCHIWFSAEYPPSADIVEHEKLHCRGYDHVGETKMQEFLARHVAAMKAASSAVARTATAGLRQAAPQ